MLHGLLACLFTVPRAGKKERPVAAPKEEADHLSVKKEANANSVRRSIDFTDEEEVVRAHVCAAVRSIVSDPYAAETDGTQLISAGHFDF